MKRDSTTPPNHSVSQSPLAGAIGSGQSNEHLNDHLNENWSPEQEQNDAVWNLLGEASSPEPTAFFARNVAREVRLLQGSSSTWGSWSDRLAAFLTPTKLTLGAAACACALAALTAYQIWPTPEAVITPAPVADNSLIESPSALSELVIEESLDAAAEDPTIFTRDEVVAMIGF